ncbi:hypothetical protein [Waddlia chondrophila]|uniref:Uncharacterized protein n=1 Tax=Waddlia chondrophila (strain ATCC VR-1470 / WSU 86-1044) TaxID=716544 RepID=D6YUY6_WADCW|nr:hypothetical protein [Waddlia chondrophila]ADI37947.1 hypothetical protein wcw_0577 [Waddlia chondrophila WSU 86-1044]
MSNFADFHTSDAFGKWKKENFEDGKIKLYREVKIGANTYKISVGYNEHLASHIDHPDQPLDTTVKKVIDESQEQIEALVKSLEQEAQPIEKVTVKTDLVKRTSTVSLKILEKEEDVLSFDQLQEKNISFQKATTGFVQFVASYLKKTTDLNPVEEIRFLENKTVGLDTYKQRTVQQLESILAQVRQQTDPGIDEHGVKRWKDFQVGGQRVEIKEFTEEAYNGPLMEDFKGRQHLVYRAVNTFLENNKENIENFGKVSKGLVELNKQFEEKYKEYQLDYKQMREGIVATDHFVEVNEKQVELIAQFARDAQALVNKSLSSGELTIDDIDRLEREEIAREGRPVVVNIFTVKGQKFFSMQTPESKDDQGKSTPTIPSTLRDQPGLANYVATSFGTISEDQQINIDHLAVRHSSYGPIAVEDDSLRQAYAIKNVKQLMTDLASAALEGQEGGASEDHPLTIPLRSMMLLTPLKGDRYYRNRKRFVAGKWTGESETQQLKESALALTVMRDRVIPLQINGRTVFVKLDSSYMNLGANKEAARMGVFGKIPLSSYEREINHRGYAEFLRDVEKHLLQQEISQECKSYLNELINRECPSEYKLKQRELQKTISGMRSMLNNKKEALEDLYMEYEGSRAPQVAKKIDSACKEIRRIEKKINKQFGELYALRMEAVDQNHENIQELQKEMINKLNEEIQGEIDLFRKKKLERTRDIVHNYFLAKEIYQSKTYRQPETVMDFQTLYLQTYEMIGYMTEFFCKSAEDRTGRIDNKIQERHAFSALYHHQPSKSDKKEIDEEIAPAIHQYSTSKDNTRFNSESPGLQISQDVNPSLTAKIDHTNATMAKRVIKKAKELSPSEIIVELERKSGS